MCDCDCEMTKQQRWALVRRAHAHELAEQIRASASKWPQKAQSLALKIVANRIDPEVEVT